MLTRRTRLLAIPGVALFLALSAFGCASSNDVPPDVDYFMPDHVLEVEIELAPADWDALREQTRDLFGTLGRPDCFDAPFASPFSYFDANVTVDGERREHVGLRKKGFLGSLDSEKPSLKIKFDEFVIGQELFGTQRITLNNARQDPSYVDQCLGYDLFARAGVPASRCNFAHVTVNGEDMGIFVHVENVKKPFLRGHFADDEGQLYEGTASDFRAGIDQTFAQKTNRDVLYDRSDIAAVEAALAPGAPADALAAVVDIDGFVDMWAMEVLVEHWDGYARGNNNYYIYNDPTDGLFHFIPWGIDAIFGEGGEPLDGPAPTSFTRGSVANHLWNTADGQARYRARMGELLDTVWDPVRLESELDRMAALLRPYLLPRDTQRDFEGAIERRREFIRTRRDRMLAALDAPYTAATLNVPMCLLPVGEIDGSFDTVFGAAAGDNPFAHPGTLDASFMGAPVAFTAVGSIGAPDDGNPTAAFAGVIGLRADGIANLVLATLPRTELRAGVSVPLDLTHATGIILELDTRVMGAMPTVVGLVGNGSISFTEAGDTDGAPLVGRIQGQAFPNIF